MRRARTPWRVSVAVLPLLAPVVLPAPAAIATHQYCGKDAEGVTLGGYAGGTQDNGHPLDDPQDEDRLDDADYAGSAAVDIAANVAMAAERVAEAISLSESMYDVLFFKEPSKEIKLGFSIAKLVAGIVTTTTDAVVLGLEQRNAEVDACGGTMLGDMIDTLAVVGIQEELGALDPVNGRGPSSTYLLPDDGAPAWTGGSELYPGHKDLAVPYVDGRANNSNTGVAVVVRNTIAHLEAHGINTGGGYVWVQGSGLVKQDGAKDLWWDAMHLLEDGRVRLAHAKFAEAYRMAVTLQTSS